MTFNRRFELDLATLFAVSFFLLCAFALPGCSQVSQLDNPALAFASEILPQVSHATYTTREGLAGNFVTSVAVAPDGTAWVGTTRGATRIDNTRWTTFTQAHGLGDDWVTSLAIAPDRRVWFGTHGGGLSVFDGRKFTTFSLSNSSLPSNFVTALAVDSKGLVWVGTLAAGLASFNQEHEKWTRYSLPNNSITALAMGAKDMPWAGTDGGGALYYDGAKWVQTDIVGSGQVRKLELDAGGIVMTTREGRFQNDGRAWKKVQVSQAAQQMADLLGLQVDEIAAAASDGERLYLATPRGLTVLALDSAALPQPPKPLPVLMVHGWTVADSDTLEDSEFKFLSTYAQEDGIPVFYAQGIRPQNTLFQNAARLSDDIAQVKETTGASKVNLIAFSMGGLNTRAYLESSLYVNDVNRVIILGTPQAGVDIWKPILARQILDKPDQPSALELTPEYSKLFNSTHAPRASVPYDLLVGDARKQPLLGFIADLPANDGLIGVGSALALTGANVRRSVNQDLHAFDPTAIPFKLTSYLYPGETYARYLRNALRDPTNAPLGSEVEAGALPSLADKVESNHSPVISGPLGAGETLTRTVRLDANIHARFLAYFPGGEVDFSLRGPDGKTYQNTEQSLAEEALGTSQGGTVGIQADIASFVGYALKNAAPGAWSLVLKRKDDGKQPLEVTTYVDLDAPQRVSGGPSRDRIDLGESITLTAMLAKEMPEAQVTAQVAVPPLSSGGAWASTEVRLSDRGRGVYSSTFTPPRAGYYLVTVNAVSGNLSRGTEFLFAVNPGGARLERTANAQVERDTHGQIENIIFDIGVQAQRLGSFAIGATLHTTDGRIAARTTIPIQVSLGSNRVSIPIEARDLAEPAPYSLDLILMDTSWAAIELDGAQNVASVQP